MAAVKRNAYLPCTCGPSPIDETKSFLIEFYYFTTGKLGKIIIVFKVYGYPCSNTTD